MGYELGKIYIIRCGEYFYYGSCITSLQRRATTHRYRATHPSIKQYQSKLYNCIKDAEWAIELVEEYPAQSKLDLLQKEDTYIRKVLNDPYCLNDRSSIWDKEKDSNRKKKWYIENKERLLKKAKIRYEIKKAFLPHS
jgi:hypothetical protein